MSSIAIPASPGIYKITNIVTGHRYIGSSVNLRNRKRTHFKELRAKIHGNPRLQNAWNKYGAEAFIFDILEFVERIEDLIAREQHYLDLLKPEYNIRLVAESNRGLTASEETRAKLSLAGKDKPKSAEHRKRIGEANRGRVINEKTRASVAAANRGRKLTPVQRAKAIANLKPPPLGKKASEAARLKMSQSHKARTRGPRSEATKQKLREWHLGRKASEETRRKLSARRTGKPQSEATRRKRGETMKLRHAERRAGGLDKHSEATKRKISEGGKRRVARERALKEQQGASLWDAP